MNIFKISFGKDKIPCLLMPCLEQDYHIIDEKNNTFFIKDNKIVGFNIFECSILKKIERDGRILVNQSLIDLLKKELKINYLFPDFQTYFYVGEIINCIKIEKTHLSLCSVNINQEKNLQIVCGAKNAKQGLKVVVACNGILMNNLMLIKPSRLQGYDSFGMLCSQKELNLKKFNDNGIIELNDQYQIGAIFKDCYIYEHK